MSKSRTLYSDVGIAATVPTSKAASKASTPATLGIFKKVAQSLGSTLDNIAEQNQAAKPDVKNDASPSARRR